MRYTAHEQVVKSRAGWSRPPPKLREPATHSPGPSWISVTDVCHPPPFQETAVRMSSCALQARQDRAVALVGGLLTGEV